MYDEEEYIRELVKDGAEGKAYLLKTSLDEIDQLISTVQAVAAGRRYSTLTLSGG